MARVGFVGLGNMGGPMAANLVKAGHDVRGFDMDEAAVARATAHGITVVESGVAAVAGCDVAFTMLPAGSHVEGVLLGGGGLLAQTGRETLFIDCSTIAVATARALHEAAEESGHGMLDAPVSGGVTGAGAGTLTFMAGGAEAAYQRGRSLLFAMGKTVVHAGGAGAGQAAKVCNNLMLGIQMISVAEAFCLAERLGLDAGTLFEISSQSSGACWALTKNCPIPGLVPGTPAERDFEAGFTAAMMLKDLRLAGEAAAGAGASISLGEQAGALYERFVEGGGGGLDFSGIIRMVRENGD